MVTDDNLSNVADFYRVSACKTARRVEHKKTSPYLASLE